MAPATALLPDGLALGAHDAADVGRAGLVEQPDGGGDVAGDEHAVAVDPDHDRVPGAAMAALSAAGVRPVGLGTVRTRGSAATSSAAISSVRSVEGPSAITTSSSPGVLLPRMP